jgi:hypothetical protein
MVVIRFKSNERKLRLTEYRKLSFQSGIFCENIELNSI